MGGYTKNIAVIRELKNGFSADGGALTGLIKCEKYGAHLKAEASLINFAPLTEGRYVTAVSDGKHTQILENNVFDGASEVDTSEGFAALVCFVNGEVSPVASAICGSFQSAALGIREEIEKAEKTDKSAASGEPAYEDEALAQENYYEYEQTDENGGVVCEDKAQEADGDSSFKNEAAFGAVQVYEGITGGLSRAPAFYEKMKNEIEGVLSIYPADETLQDIVEDSRWVKIDYGDKKFYVFGVIYGGGKPQYVCYGVPSKSGAKPPESLAGLASFIPAGENSGYWIMYQDAATGASVKIETE